MTEEELFHPAFLTLGYPEGRDDIDSEDTLDSHRKCFAWNCIQGAAPGRCQNKDI